MKNKKYRLFISSVICSACVLSVSGNLTASAAKTPKATVSPTEAADTEKQTAETKSTQKTNETEKTTSGIVVKKADKQLYTTADLNVRSDANLNSKVLGVLLPGDKVQVTGICENNWTRISYNEKEGFVSSDYLSAENKIEKTPSGVIVTKTSQKLYAATGVYVRSDSNSRSEKLGILEGGDSIKVTGICSNGWMRVTYKGSTGYVYGEYLEEEYSGAAQTGDSIGSSDEEAYQEWLDENYPNGTGEPSSDEEAYQEWLKENYPYGTEPSSDEDAYQEWLKENYPYGTGPSSDEEAYQEWLEENYPNGTGESSSEEEAYQERLYNKYGTDEGLVEK